MHILQEHLEFILRETSNERVKSCETIENYFEDFPFIDWYYKLLFPYAWQRKDAMDTFSIKT